jgi:hypothetical protein
MDANLRISLAKEAMRQRKEETKWIVTWSAGGEPQTYSGIAGFQQLCRELNIKEVTLNVYLSNKGGHHYFKGVNPTTGEEDIATINRRYPPAKPKNPRGRPRKVTDWERLGSEAPGFEQAGFTKEPEFFPRKFAANTRAKDRNRRTDEKQ